MQKKIYDIILCIADSLIALISRHPSMLRLFSHKTALFIKGQGEVMQKIKATDVASDKPVYWFHCASLGEHGIAFPLMKQLRNEQDCTIILTFFSSTGIEAALSRGNEKMGADHVFHLPLDTRRNAITFLNHIHPDRAIFMVSEYWVNYLTLLGERHIKTYLVSAVITHKTVFMRWFGKIYRNLLNTYDQIFVLSKSSSRILSRLHFHRCTVSGDPLFDNAATKALLPYENPILDRFCEGHKVFIAGSIHDKEDLTLASALANNHPELKCIFVPHEVQEPMLQSVLSCLKGKAMLYRDCNEHTDFSNVQVLVIDFVGALAQMYRYGTWAYVGGGFTPYLHSVIEPSVYGLPVSFGPMIGRKVPPREMVHRGIGRIVTKIEELEQWFLQVQDNNELHSIHEKAKAYVTENEGATKAIVNRLLSHSV